MLNTFNFEKYYKIQLIERCAVYNDHRADFWKVRWLLEFWIFERLCAVYNDHRADFWKSALWSLVRWFWIFNSQRTNDHRADFWKFQNLFRIPTVSALQNILCKTLTELTFENFRSREHVCGGESSGRNSQNLAHWKICCVKWPRSWLLRISDREKICVAAIPRVEILKTTSCC